MVDDRYPDPTVGYGYCRAAKIVEGLRALGHQLILAPTEKQNNGAPVTVIDCNSFEEQRWESLGSLIDTVDAVWVSRFSNLRWTLAQAPSFRLHQAWLYDCEALHSTRNQLWVGLGNPVRAGMLLSSRLEAEAVGTASVVIAASRLDAEVLAANGTPPQHIVGHPIAARPTEAGFEARAGILFLGSFFNADQFSPNSDAAEYLCREIAPRLACLQIPITVAGHRASAIKSRLGTLPAGIRLIEDVADLGELYNAHRLVVAPTRFCSGIPWKVHEAMAFGVPIVMSRVLAAQLAREMPELEGFYHRWSADCPREYTSVISTLYAEPDAWRDARSAGLRTVAKACDPQRFQQELAAATARLAAKGSYRPTWGNTDADRVDLRRQLSSEG